MHDVCDGAAADLGGSHCLGHVLARFAVKEHFLDVGGLLLEEGGAFGLVLIEGGRLHQLSQIGPRSKLPFVQVALLRSQDHLIELVLKIVSLLGAPEQSIDQCDLILKTV